jgi:hypothetical protein
MMYNKHERKVNSMTADVVQTIIQIINGCGFPIAACVGMAWFIVWNKKQVQENKKYNYENLREAIDNNTKVMQELCSHLRAQK